MLAAVFNLGEDDDDDQNAEGAADEGVINLNQAISEIRKEKGKGNPIVDSLWFNLGVTAVVFLNTLQMGIEAEYPEARNVWVVTENIFTACFFIEMVIKISILKSAYFHDRANWLDAVLTCFGVLDCWILVWLPGDTVDLQSMSILRILRLARLGRVVKLARKVKQFVLVISGVYKALVTTCWVFLLLVFVMYVCAIFCTEYIGRGTEDLYPGYSKDDAIIDEQEIMANFNPYLSFGKMWFSILTLFNIAVGGEWAEIVRPMAIRQPLLVVLFVGYAMLIAFGVMNVMIGIIVDSVITESKNLDHEMQEKHKSEKRALLQRIQSLIRTLDTNHDEVVDLRELRASFAHMTQLQELLAQCDLPAGWNSNELLFMLDNSGDGVLQKAEFTTSFFRLMDSDDFQQICIMQASINQVKHLVRQAHDKLEVHMAEMRKGLSQIHNALVPEDPPEKVFEADTALDGESGDGDDENIHRTDKPEEILEAEVEAARPEVQGVACKPDTNSCQKDAQYDNSALQNHVVEWVDMARTQATNAAAVAAHLSEEPIKALPGPRPTDDEHGYALQSITKELESGIKSIPLKKITDVLDLAFLAMRDSLHRELAALSQGEEMRVIAKTGEAINTAPISSAECSTSAEGSSSLNASPVQEPIASCGTLLEASTACCVLRSEKGINADCNPTGIELGKDVVRQELDRQSKPTSKNSRPPCHTDGVTGDVATEDFESVASESHAADARYQEKAEVFVRQVSHATSFSCDPNGGIEVVFRDEEKLGFEIQWFQDAESLPLVRMTAPGGASELRGVRQGDSLVQCNGTSIRGKGRDAVLRLLKQRPLVLRLHRVDWEAERPQV